jgi:hypothetical protein
MEIKNGLVRDKVRTRENEPGYFFIISVLEFYVGSDDGNIINNPPSGPI